MRSTVSHRGQLATACVAVLLVFASACDPLEPAEVEGEASYAISLDVPAVAPAAFDVAPSQLLLSPDEVVVYVGEELEIDLVLAQPELGEIHPSQLPADMEFIRDDIGATSVRWTPELSDVGDHTLSFWILDPEEPAVVIADTDILVSVLPRFSLIEYGF